MRSLYLWGRSTQVMGGDVLIGRSIYGVVVIDGSLYSRFYGMHCKTCKHILKDLMGVLKKSQSQDICSSSDYNSLLCSTGYNPR